MGRPKEDDVISTKITVGLNDEYDNFLEQLAKKLKRNKADTIRTMIDYGYRHFVTKDPDLDKDMKLEEEIVV